MKRFYLFFLISLILTIFSGTVFATDLIVDIFSIESTSIEPTTIYSGDIVNLEIKLKNNGTLYAAENVNVSLALSEAFEGINTEYFFDKIFASQSASAVFKFKVKESANPGKYSFPLKLTYVRNTHNVSEGETVTLTVSEISKLDITDIDLSNAQPHIEESLSITAKVRNIGSSLARQVTVSLNKSGSSTFGDFITLGTVKKELGNLSANEEKLVVFEIMPGKKITPGIYSFELNASCLDCTSEAKETISFEVLGKPELILSGIDFSVEGRDEKKIVQGDTFSLSVQLDNIGKEPAKAVEITVDVDEGINGSKKSYVGTIDDDDSGSGIFNFTVDNTAVIGKHSAVITVTYIDETGKMQSFSKNYDIFVNAMPPADLRGLLILLIILLVVAYFFVKTIFRQLAMRKI